MSSKESRREAPAVNAGSMADIAFLLLIFFLVTTTIAEEQGVLVKLPEWSEKPVKQPLDDEKVLTVLVNKSDELLVEDKEVAMSQVQSLVVDHVRKGLDRPGTRIVSLTHDRGTSYQQYLAVYDALKSGYQELWDEAAREQFGKVFDQLEQQQQQLIRNQIPLVISEAEPTEV